MSVLLNNNALKLCDETPLLNKFMQFFDASYNEMEQILPWCFKTTPRLVRLNLKHNQINCIAQNAFEKLTELFVLNLSHNNLVIFNSNIFQNTNVRFIFLQHNSFHILQSHSFANPNVLVMESDKHEICCLKPPHSVCSAPAPWYISCTDLLVSFEIMTTFYCLSAFIIVLNFLSAALHVSIFVKARKIFPFAVALLNMTDFQCGVYMSIVWLGDLVYRGNFAFFETQWKSSQTCFFALGMFLSFTLLSPLLLCFLSASRCHAVLFPMKNRNI